MPFITGSANSIPELRTAFINGLVANGFTLDGNVLYKGDVFVDVTIPSGESGGDDRMIRFLAGTGQLGGVLSGDAPIAPRLGFAKDTTWTFPVSYNLHILTDPDEVYFKVRRDVNEYQFAALGQGNVEGLPGSSNWLTATFGDSSLDTDYLYIRSNGNSITQAGYYVAAQAPFWSQGRFPNTTLNVGMDGTSWAEVSNKGTSIGDLCAARTVYPHLDRSPNNWNSEATLLPIQPTFMRASNKQSIVGDLAHARYLRIDNYNPEEIIDLSPDKWMVYPFRAKNSDERDGSPSNVIYHTGTFGWAIRYDGP